MGDLRQNQMRMGELVTFIGEREGNRRFFYCDSNGFVTIGIGTLVATQQDARRIAADPSVRFTFRSQPNQNANAQDIVADWHRVQATPGLPEADYARVAELRIDERSIAFLLMQELSRSADALYRAHPFVLGFDSRVAMAFVDLRYNPAGINPYSSAETKPLWAALDPRSPQFDPNTAVDLFKRIWANRGGDVAARYAGRHRQRTQWLQQGLQAMGAPGALRSVPD